MSRQNLGALIVTVAVVLGLIVAVFIVPMIQPRSLEAASDLDQAAERAARRLGVMQRMANQAVAADRQALTLPESIRKPDTEALQRAMANKSDLIDKSAGEASSNFRRLLAKNDKRYEAMTGRKPSDGEYGEKIQVPVGEAAQINWVQQSLAKGEDPSARMLKDMDTAISDLQQSISAISLEKYRGADHFRANWLLGSLQHQKAMYLTSLAANRRAKVEAICTQMKDEYRWHASADAQAKGIAARLQEVSVVKAAAPVAAPAKVTPPPSAMEAAVDAAGPAPVAPDASATSEQPAGEQPSGLLARVGSLLKGTSKKPEAAPVAPAAENTAQAAPAAESPALTGLPATEDPSVLAAKYEQEIETQVAATEKKIVELQQEMASPQQQLLQTNEQLEQLQQKLTQLEQAGYDVTSIESFEAYKKSYSDLKAQLRTLEAKAQALQEGTLAGAEINPDGSDDLTKATYKGGEPQVGLTTLGRRLEGQQKTLALLKEARQEMQGLLASLQQQKLGQEKALQVAQGRAKDLSEQMAKTYAEMDDMLARAAAEESKALNVCKSAIQTFQTAQQAAKKQTGDASNDLAQANPSPEKRNERLEQLRDYTQPEAACEQSLFNAYMLTAQIQLQRALGLQSCRTLLASVQATGVETKVAELDKTIEESLDAAIAAADATDSESDAVHHAEAYGRLLTASKDKERCTWLGPALQGLAYNLLSQAQAAKGQPQQATEARTKAVEALSEATKGNETSELLQPYTHLLASLRKGSGQ